MQIDNACTDPNHIGLSHTTAMPADSTRLHAFPDVPQQLSPIFACHDKEKKKKEG